MIAVKDIFDWNLIRPSSENRILVAIPGKYVYSSYYNRFPLILYRGNIMRVVNKKTAIDNGYHFSTEYDCFVKDGENLREYTRGDLKHNHFVQCENILSISKKQLTIKDEITFGIKSPTCLISEQKRFTFGCEIETSSGRVEPFLFNKLNVKAVRDGSLYDDNGHKAMGGEYVTGVLTGDTGFLQLKKLLKVLSTRTMINKTCSVHVHIGNFDFNKETVVMLWKLGLVLQNELYSMMPESRKHVQHCQRMRGAPSSIVFTKQDDYNRKINYYYERIIRNVSLVGGNSKIINKSYNHPRGHYCGYDTSTPRYWWLNFVPALFNLKGTGNNTIEFRMHSGTLNYVKIRNWVLICMGIVSAAIDHKQFLIKNNKFTLEDIMKLTYKQKGNYLSSYIAERKELFSNNNFSSMIELSEYVVKPVTEKITFKNLIWD